MSLYARTVKLAKSNPKAKPALDRILLQKVSFDLDQEVSGLNFGDLAEEETPQEDTKKKIARGVAYYTLKYMFSYPVRTFISRLLSYVQDVIASPVAGYLEKQFHIPSFITDAAFFYLSKKLSSDLVQKNLDKAADKVLKPIVYGQPDASEDHSLAGIKLAKVASLGLKKYISGFVQWMKNPRQVIQEMKPLMTNGRLDKKKLQRWLTLRNMQTLSSAF